MYDTYVLCANGLYSQSQKGEVSLRSLTDVCPYAELFAYFISFGCLFASYPVNLPLFNSVTVTTFKAMVVAVFLLEKENRLGRETRLPANNSSDMNSVKDDFAVSNLSHLFFPKKRLENKTGNSS